MAAGQSWKGHGSFLHAPPRTDASVLKSMQVLCPNIFAVLQFCRAFKRMKFSNQLGCLNFRKLCYPPPHGQVYVGNQRHAPPRLTSPF